MTRRRFIADVVTSDTAALTGDHAGHLIRVLRVRIGQEFDIATGDSVRRGKVISVAEDRVEFELAETVPVPRTANVSVALAIFKFDRMEWAIEKCVELGAARIIPVIASRTDAHLVAASAKRVERWRRIALRAAEQSRRATPPELLAPQRISLALGIQASLRIVLSEVETEIRLLDVLDSDSNSEDILLAIGPEGGWTSDELSAFRQSGWLSASLGPTILRAETAAIAAMAIAVSTRL